MNWHEERRKGIGGSDVAAILGMSPYKNAMDVWLDKMGLAADVAPDPQTQFLLDLGKELEPVIANCYMRETGKALAIGHSYVHGQYSMLRGNPDRLVVGEHRGVELKTESVFSDKFGEPGTDQVPPHYLLQCVHYMALLDYPAWDVALLRGGANFSIFTIERDAELERDVIEQCVEWWQKHIIGAVPPDIDGSGAWKTYLRKKYPRDILPIKSADEETLKLINNLAVVREIVEKYTGVEQELANRVKFIIGDHEGIEGDFGKITWRRSKDSTKTDWKECFFALGRHHKTEPAIFTDITQLNTITKPGTRRFLFVPNKGWMNERSAITEGGLSDAAYALQGGDREGAAPALERGSDDADRAHELPAKPEAGAV